MYDLTIGLTEAKANLGRITEEVSKTGVPVTIFKNNKPLVVMYPAAINGTHNRETLSTADESRAILESTPRFSRFEDMMDRLRRDAADA
ncbi:MAG: type II toxin-antitoxin system Phd/YefM family antitoxin [Coriobacteriales bacterium]|jgi:prevent-host-death family protein|nr:type II toxin-antitoxin system Phd/YefM family antitoxin [Coriobacteriales bacterium]